MWFVTGSQHLYGPETLEQVAEHSRAIARALGEAAAIPVRVVFKPVLTTPDEIHRLAREANAAADCAGLVTWMHTFSPAKMWIARLRALQKPFLHLHTQFNREIPWGEIDMDVMNLNQAAHGDREFGFVGSRMRLERKVVVGPWQDADVQSSVGAWARAACAWHDAQGARFARFGDNKREIAVTEGDKVGAQMRLGYSVNGYGVGDLVRVVDAVSDAEVDRTVAEYDALYVVAPALRAGGTRHQSLRDGARIEIRIRGGGGLEDGGVSPRDDGDGRGGGRRHVVHGGLHVPPTCRPAAGGPPEPGRHAGARLPHARDLPDDRRDAAVARGAPARDRRQGGPRKARLRCEGRAGGERVDRRGGRYRMVVNRVEAVVVDRPMPKLPVARALWRPEPDLATSAAAWIYAGGAHHTGFSFDVTAEQLADLAETAGMEFLLIDQGTTVADSKKELRWNDLYYHLAKGL